MIFPRVIPILLLRRNGLYKGVRFRDFKYVGDPMNAVRVFNDKRVDEIFFVDVEATAENRIPDLEFVQNVADEAYMPFGVGGGIRTVEQARALLAHGSEKVLVNTAAFENPDLIRRIADRFGSQSVVIGIDYVRPRFGKPVVVTHCARKKTHCDPIEWGKKAVECGAGEILLTSVDRDGTGMGYDLDMIRRMSEAVPVPVIACGGAGSYEHLSDAIRAGAAAAAAGSLFVFHGPHRSVLINYPPADVLAHFQME
jgi:cyclase